MRMWKIKIFITCDEVLVAQSIEHQAAIAGDMGSNPTDCENFYKY